jgi:mono/diheme cytochrome c family protein
VVASLFTFVQTRFEGAWSRQGLLPLPREMAERLARVYEWGGLWSPEMLTFILHVGALVVASVTLLVLLYSTPKLALGLEGYLTTIAFVVLIAAAAVLDVARRSELRLADSAFVPPSAQRALPAVKAFGWARRAPIGQDRLKTANEIYAAYCQACHGEGARGLQNLGLNLTTSQFVAKRSDSDLIAFLREGRSPDAKDSVTKKLMPGMKNYAGFAEEYYAKIVEHIRKLNKPQGG